MNSFEEEKGEKKNKSVLTKVELLPVRLENLQGFLSYAAKQL